MRNMKLKKLALMVAAALCMNTAVRAKTLDSTAITFRMGAGFPGDVNRTHPAEVEGALTVVANPPTAYGQVVVVNSTGNYVRPLGVADASDATLLTPFGLTVRPFPTQQTTGGMSASLGAATPPTSGVIDVLRAGLIMVQLNDITAALVKGQRVWVWCAATAGVHVQGGIEAVFSAGNTVELDQRYTFNGPADANGVAEISANV